MLGFHALGSRPISGGKSRPFRFTGALSGLGGGGATSSYLPIKKTLADATAALTTTASAVTYRAGSTAGLGTPLAAGVLGALRSGGTSCIGRGSVDGTVGLGIRIGFFVVTAGGLAGVSMLPIYLGRPGTQTAADGLLYGYERDGDDVVLIVQREADAQGGPESRPAAESVVPASRLPGSTTREPSRKASGASASTQRSASGYGPALRSADSSNDPGLQR